MKYSHLLFDLDGTLVDSLADLVLSVNLLRAELALSELPSEEVAKATGDGAASLVERCLPERAGGGPYVARFLEIYSRHLLEHTAPYQGISELLEHLPGHRLAVVTNKPFAQAEQILAGVGLKRYFPVVVGGECAAAKKPSPLPLQLALRRLEYHAGQVLMVGDHHTDLRAGQAAGLDTCFCRWGLGDSAGLASTFEVASVAELHALLAGEK